MTICGATSPDSRRKFDPALPLPAYASWRLARGHLCFAGRRRARFHSNSMRHSLSRAASRAAMLAAASLIFLPSALAQVTFDVDTTDDTPDAMPGDGICADSSGACSLRAAVQEANASMVPTVIRLQAGMTYGLDRVGAGEDLANTGDLDILCHLTIEGRGATIDARAADRALDVRYRYVLDVRDLTIVNGAVIGESGGAARNAGALLMEGCEISASSASGAGASGGAIFNDAGLVTVMRSRLSTCSATRSSRRSFTSSRP
jgi:CSLREA domain-containing protein